MGRSFRLILAVLTIAAGARATPAEAMVFSPPDLELAAVQCEPCADAPSLSRLTRTLNNRVAELYADATEPAAVEPPGAYAMRSSFVASYGTGETTCTISARMNAAGPDYRDFEGITDCSRDVQQSAQAWVVGASGSAAAPSCSGWQALCRSAGWAYGSYSDVHYQISITAPNGEGWVAAPSECSGVGTDNLKCTF